MVNKTEKEKPKFRWGFAILIIFMLTFLGFIMAGCLALFSSENVDLSGNVALISVDGVIIGSDDNGLFDEGTSSLDVVELIEEANNDPSIKAIVLEINSPGGSAVASEEIADAIKKVNKTTVAWIREVGASGGYWIASATDHIVANRASITGSIGVIASYLELNGFLDRYNITYRRLVAGEYKDIGTPFKEMTPEEQKVFQEALDDLRDYFVDEVAKNRKMARKDIDKAANGMFYIGSQAKNLGLIDELGGKDEVIAYIEQKESIKVDFIEYKKEESLIEMLSGVIGKQSFNIGQGIGSSFTRQRNDLSVMT